MKVLSLFDGMSCGQIALNRLGIKVDKYYASEIDKYAIQVTQANFPETIQIGDVCDLKAEDYQDVDLIMAGSPCQGFSFAGKQLAFDDPRSALFFEFIRLLKEIKPKYFLLENVKMKKEYLQVISEQVSACYPEIPFGIEPHFINSSLVSAQNRQRYYWTNIPNITQPEERGIVLRDILEDRVGSEFFAGYELQQNYKGGNQLNPNYKSQANTIHDSDKKAGTICAGTHGYANGYVKDVDSKYYLSKKAIDYMNRGSKKYTGKKTRAEHYIRHESEKSKTLTANMYKGVPYGVIATDKTDNLDKMTTKDGKSYCLTTTYSLASPSNSMERKQRTMIPVKEGQELPKDTTLIYDNDGKSHKPEHIGTAVDGIMLVDDTSDLPDKSTVIKSNYYKSSKANFENDTSKGGKFSSTGIKQKPIQVGTAVDVNGHDILKRVYSPDGKSPTINTMNGGNREPKVVVGAYRGRYNQDGSTSQKLELRKDNKTNSITTVQKDNVLTKDQVYWRKLTPLECERLQTVPDNYTNHVSNTQRYKMLGNGWTVEVICHILKNMELDT